MNNHDGTFREEALMRGVALDDDGKEMAGMGVGVGDYDCDGRLDIVRTHYMNQPTGLYHNHGKGEFEDVTARAGLIHERRFVSWGVGMFDFDNDGNPDIFLVTGQVYPELEAGQPKVSTPRTAHPLPKPRQRDLRGVAGRCTERRLVVEELRNFIGGQWTDSPSTSGPS